MLVQRCSCGCSELADRLQGMKALLPVSGVWRRHLPTCKAQSVTLTEAAEGLQGSCTGWLVMSAGPCGPGQQQGRALRGQTGTLLAFVRVCRHAQ